MKRLQYRVGTAAEFTAKNPILARDEMGIEKDTGKEKIGDGSTRWADLAYFPDASVAVSLTAPDNSVYVVSVDNDGSLITTKLSP